MCGEQTDSQIPFGKNINQPAGCIDSDIPIRYLPFLVKCGQSRKF